MLNFLIAVLAGLVCGVLSGFGIGGGSLLMVWMTAVLAMEQKAAQGINLLYFLPTAVCALIFHAKHRQICWKAVVPAALAGCAAAVPGALLAASLEMELLRKLFGGFLCFYGDVRYLKPGVFNNLVFDFHSLKLFRTACLRKALSRHIRSNAHFIHLSVISCKFLCVPTI